MHLKNASSFVFWFTPLRKRDEVVVSAALGPEAFLSGWCFSTFLRSTKQSESIKLNDENKEAYEQFLFVQVKLCIAGEKDQGQRNGLVSKK